MNVLQHLSWENFRATVLRPGQQRVHRVTDSPCIEVFGDGARNRIGVWLEVDVDTTIPPEIAQLACITTRTFSLGRRSFIEIATAIESLHRQFYYFAVAVAERVVVDKRQPIDAISLELKCFTDLLEAKPILGTERQLGLLGELLFLECLIARHGVGVLDAWLGPIGEPHDFRVGMREFEVKTTVSTRRIHTIHGAEQLVASKDCSLCLVSVLLGPPGASGGSSLAEKVAELSSEFANIPVRLTQFTRLLETCGFQEADGLHYTRRYAMRRPIGLIRVDTGFPAITRPAIQNALGVLAPRIESFQYDVNVEGLEHEDGTAEFQAGIQD